MNMVSGSNPSDFSNSESTVAEYLKDKKTTYLDNSCKQFLQVTEYIS